MTASTTHAVTLLTEEELAELDRFLSSDATGDEVMMLDTLDGYLTAIAIGPVTLPAHRWLPRVWGPKEGEAPNFDSAEQAERIMGLIQRHLNGIIDRLHVDAEAFSPILDQVSYQDKEKEFLDGEMWSYGFLTGLGLARREWQPLFEHESAMAALHPIYLLGADDLNAEQRKQTNTPAQREALAKQIAASVATLYRFWLPYREALHERIVATTIQRESPKVGRNDPCPCGSGKKFKKCCGVGAELH